MPAYSASVAPIAIYPGDTETVWSAEKPTTGTASEAVALSIAPLGVAQSLNVEIVFSADPGTVVVDLQIADSNVAAAYSNLASGGTIANTDLNAAFYGTLSITAIRANFARLIMTNDPSNDVSITAKITR